MIPPFRHLVVFALFLSLATVLSCSSGSSENGIEQNERAIEHIVAGEYVQAIALLDEAIRLDDTNPTFHENRGIAYRSMGFYDSAIESFDRQIILDPSFAPAYNHRGMAEYASPNGSPFRALKDFDRAIELDPEFFEAYLNRCQLQRADYFLDEALDDCNAALELEPESSEALYRRGLVHSWMKSYPLAIVDFTEAIRIDDSREGDAYRERARAHAELGNFAAAESDLLWAKVHQVDVSAVEARISALKQKQ